MNVSSVTAPQTATTPAAGSVEPRISKALEVTKEIQFALSLAAGPMPSVEAIRQAATGAHEVADSIWAGDARRGDIYGPLYTSASVNAKAGAEALNVAADMLEKYGQNDPYEIMDRQSILASTTLTQALKDLTQLREYGV